MPGETVFCFGGAMRGTIPCRPEVRKRLFPFRGPAVHFFPRPRPRRAWIARDRGRATGPRAGLPRIADPGLEWSGTSAIVPPPKPPRFRGK